VQNSLNFRHRQGHGIDGYSDLCIASSSRPTMSPFEDKTDIANSPRYVRNFNLLRPVMAYPD
jgi:hypothetical protein